MDGIVTVPVPVPSEPIGKAEVPVRVYSVPPLEVPKVTVKIALVPSAVLLSTEKQAMVIVKASPGLTVVGDSVIALVVRLNVEPDEAARLAESVSKNSMVLLIPLPEVAASVGIVVV